MAKTGSGELNKTMAGAISHGVTIVPICTTSKFEPLIVFSVLSSSSFQRGSGAPLQSLQQFAELAGHHVSLQ